MYEDYDWFLAEIDGNGGVMNTDYATINYITLKELDNLEDCGIIVRITEDGRDFIFPTRNLLENYIV